MFKRRQVKRFALQSGIKRLKRKYLRATSHRYTLNLPVINRRFAGAITA